MKTVFIVLTALFFSTGMKWQGGRTSGLVDRRNQMLNSVCPTCYWKDGDIRMEGQDVVIRNIMWLERVDMRLLVLRNKIPKDQAEHACKGLELYDFGVLHSYSDDYGNVTLVVCKSWIRVVREYLKSDPPAETAAVDLERMLTEGKNVSREKLYWKQSDRASGM